MTQLRHLLRLHILDVRVFCIEMHFVPGHRHLAGRNQHARHVSYLRTRSYLRCHGCGAVSSFTFVLNLSATRGRKLFALARLLSFLLRHSRAHLARDDCIGSTTVNAR